MAKSGVSIDARDAEIRHLAAGQRTVFVGAAALVFSVPRSSLRLGIVEHRQAEQMHQHLYLRARRRIGLDIEDVAMIARVHGAEHGHRNIDAGLRRDDRGQWEFTHAILVVLRRHAQDFHRLGADVVEQNRRMAGIGLVDLAHVLRSNETCAGKGAQRRKEQRENRHFQRHRQTPGKWVPRTIFPLFDTFTARHAFGSYPSCGGTSAASRALFALPLRAWFRDAAAMREEN